MELVAKDVEVYRGEERILSGVSFSVGAGAALEITGDNGTGKSTLLMSISGLLPLTFGSIKLENREAEFEGLPLAELCHLLGSGNAMKDAHNVEDNLSFWRNYHGEPHLEVDEALEMVGLDGLQAVPFGHLSTGQKRRAAICRLLVSWRPVWLLDEPTSGLDAHSVKQFSELMQVHLEDGGLIVAATHLPLGLPDRHRKSLSLEQT